MKRVTIIFIFSIFIIFLSCDEQIIFVKCADCIEEEPVEATLEVKLDHIIENVASVNVKIYEGNIEDNVLLGTYYVIELTWLHNVPINKKYTLSVTYWIDNAAYVAVNTAFPRVRYETEQCEKPCYFVYGNSVNLKVKYTK
jgi:hypothetical protein